MSMDNTDHDAIYLARNKTRRQYKIYLYEAEAEMLRTLSMLTDGKQSRSDIMHIILSCFLEQKGFATDYLKTGDRLKMRQLRRAISQLK